MYECHRCISSLLSRSINLEVFSPIKMDIQWGVHKNRLCLRWFISVSPNYTIIFLLPIIPILSPTPATNITTATITATNMYNYYKLLILYIIKKLIVIIVIILLLVL